MVDDAAEAVKAGVLVAGVPVTSHGHRRAPIHKNSFRVPSVHDI